MNAALLKILLAAAGKSAEQGTLFEIIATAGRLLRLIEPLLDHSTDVEPSTQATSQTARRDTR